MYACTCSHFSIAQDMVSFQSLLLSYPELLLAVVSFFSLAVFRLVRRTRQSLVPVSWPMLGMLPYVVKYLDGLHDNITDVLREVGCTFMFRGPRLVNMSFLLTCDPAAVHHCLSTNFANYDKGRDFAEMFDILGDGLLVADVATWVRQRQVASAVFGASAFRSFVLSTVVRQTARELLPYLDHMAARRLDVELEDVFMRFSLDVSYSIVFTSDLDALSVSSPFPPFGEATNVAGETVLFRHVVPSFWWKLLRWLNVGTEKRLAEAKVVLDEFIYKEIADRKARWPRTECQGDFLSMYMAWSMDAGMTERQRDQFLRDSAVGLIFAAKDLIAAALTWLFYMLCTHPHAEAKILAELRSLQTTCTTGEGEPTMPLFDADTLRSAVYLHAAILETLRLYPSAPFEEKEALGDDVLPDGTTVAKGTRVVFCLYAMGRIQGVWGDDCIEFRPERWLSNNGRLRHEPTYKFAAFNTGPRSCLGKDLGLRNLKIAAAAILYNFQVELVEGHIVEPQNSVVLSTKNGLMVRVKRREETCIKTLVT